MGGMEAEFSVTISDVSARPGCGGGFKQKRMLR